MKYSEKVLRSTLDAVKKKKLTEEQAFQKLKNLPYESFGFAKIDHHRHFRKGFPEVVYSPGKTIEQMVKILKSLIKSGQPVLVTRLEPERFRKLKKSIPALRYSAHGRIAYHADLRAKEHVPSVAVLTAGTSDIPVAEEAAVTLEVIGYAVKRIYDCGVAAVHRLFDELSDLNNVKAIICVAGMEGALPSVVAGLVDKPVIAVPTSVGYGANFKGLSSLLTMMNSCAQGIAVVNIDNGFGAACFAASILKTRSQFRNDRVIVLETNIDDMSPQGFEILYKRLLDAGALDVYVIPILMKKMRPAHKLSVIFEERLKEKISEIVFRETPVFGVRFLDMERFILGREKKIIATPYGKISVKLGSINGAIHVASPEYDDCKKAALKKGVPFRKVYEAARERAKGLISRAEIWSR